MSLLDREFCEVCEVEKRNLSIGHNAASHGVRRWWCSMWCFLPPPEEVLQAQLLLIRGLPGSGKSSMAKSVLNRRYFDHHLEADMFHMSRGRYIYEPVHSADAHAWCLNTTRVYLNNNRRVVVANTFVMLDQLRPYMTLGFPFHIVEARGAWGSTHNVPEEIVDAMRRRWQELP